MRSSNLAAVSPEMPYCRRSAGTTAMLLAILLTSSLVAYRAMEGARLTPPNRHAPLISHSFGLGALQLIASCFVYTVAPWTLCESRPSTAMCGCTGRSAARSRR